MARYRKIDPRIWNDSKFASLNHEGQRLFLYILTHPSMTSLGAFRSSRLGILEELGLDPKEFGEAFDEPLRKGLFKYDAKTSLIFAPNFLKYNPPENPNVVKGWAGALDLIPECPIKLEVLLKAQECVNANKDGVKKAFANTFESVIETLSKEFAQPFQKSLAKQEQEQEQNIYNTNKQHTQVCNEGSAANDSVCSDGVEEKKCSEVKPEDKPLTSDEMLTACKMFGIDLNKNARIEAIAQRKTITMKVLADCIEAWKQTGTGPGYFVVSLEKAAKDPTSVTTHAPVAHTAVAEDRAMNIASKLIVDGQFNANLGWKYPSVDVLACDLKKPGCFKQFKPYLLRLGLIGGQQ